MNQFSRVIFQCFILATALLFLGACSFKVPQPPNRHVVASTTQFVNDITLERMASKQSHGRNLVFVAEDTEEASRFEGFLKSAYPKKKTTPRLEEAAWWLYAPAIKDLYDNVFLIQYGHLNKESFLLALTEAEHLEGGYDLVLFTHGVPNNIVTSPENPIFSWKDLDALKGQLPKLRLVFMQGCFGSSLALEWVDAGAQAVLSFPDLNRNFFYLGFFLERLKESPNDIKAAYDKTNINIADEIRKNLLYIKMISVLNENIEEYLAYAPNPALMMRVEESTPAKP